MSDDVYCERILNGVEPVDIVFEDADVVAYHHPLHFFADAHVVVVPKRHVASLLDPDADAVLPALLRAVRVVADGVLAEQGAARVLTNLGRYQDSKHLHVHVCASSDDGDGSRRPLSGRERPVAPLGQPS
ncbi:MAG TPA: HIT family protein [Acidimicrobiales bacterium]|nr:HIT family protein [Acidimicrobiales bacterium]